MVCSPGAGVGRAPRDADSKTLERRGRRGRWRLCTWGGPLLASLSRPESPSPSWFQGHTAKSAKSLELRRPRLPPVHSLGRPALVPLVPGSACD